MFSHVVLFWTKSEIPDAADQLVAGAQKYLQPIPGVVSFHVGKMVASDRPVVDQSYQVGLNVIFADKQAQDVYQSHPLHLDFIREIGPVWEKVKVYDFC